MKKLKILLIGQPNIGKSSLLNAFVGSRVIVSNYPGTTVEITKAKKKVNNTEIEFVDTPGIYSISDRSEEEKVTEKALFEEDKDGVIMVTDATSLERSLYMVLQVLEAGIPGVLALNFIEDAEKKGIKINYGRLRKLLGIPVVPINPLTRMGVGTLMETILRIRKRTGEVFRVRYDDHIEKAVNKIISQIKETSLPKRFIALRLLEGDEDFYKYLKNSRVIEATKRELENHPKVAEDISITRYGTACFIAEKVSRIVPVKSEKKLEERIDNILIHCVWGPFITGLFFLIVFGTLLYLGNLIQSFLMGLAESVLSPLFEIAKHSIVVMVLIQGLFGLAAGISIALPYVFLFYLFLGLLEDIGLLSRFIVNVERLLKKLGLAAKSFIPLILGLGCTTPAIRPTRSFCKKPKTNGIRVTAGNPSQAAIGERGFNMTLVRSIISRIP